MVIKQTQTRILDEHSPTKIMGIKHSVTRFKGNNIH